MKAKLTSLSTEILMFLGLFIAEMSLAMFVMGILIMIDTTTGVWAAFKKGGTNAITSRKLGRVITKLVLYPICILVAWLMQYMVPEIPFTKVTLGILATVEGKSIFENVSKILGYDLIDRLKKAIWKDKTGQDADRKDK